jgi:hypothetical protein
MGRIAFRDPGILTSTRVVPSAPRLQVDVLGGVWFAKSEWVRYLFAEPLVDTDAGFEYIWYGRGDTAGDCPIQLS